MSKRIDCCRRQDQPLPSSGLVEQLQLPRATRGSIPVGRSAAAPQRSGQSCARRLPVPARAGPLRLGFSAWRSHCRPDTAVANNELVSPIVTCRGRAIFYLERALEIEPLLPQSPLSCDALRYGKPSGDRHYRDQPCSSCRHNSPARSVSLCLVEVD